VYNKAIATSDTDIIVNSVIVLFIMEIDEYIFSAVDAMNEKWTEHAADTKISEMEKEVARQRAQIASQQEKIDNQQKDLKRLREAVEKIQESQASAFESAESSSSTCAQQADQVDQITMPCQTEQNTVELSSSSNVNVIPNHLSMTTHESDYTGQGRSNE
jgi:septal ring factor EnvC (AmiA/AmiB activator)